MKKMLKSLLLFVALFVPFYLMMAYSSPSLQAEMMENGLLKNILTTALKGLAGGVVLIGGVWVVDKLKRK